MNIFNRLFAYLLAASLAISSPITAKDENNTTSALPTVVAALGTAVFGAFIGYKMSQQAPEANAIKETNKDKKDIVQKIKEFIAQYRTAVYTITGGVLGLAVGGGAGLFLMPNSPKNPDSLDEKRLQANNELQNATEQKKVILKEHLQKNALIPQDIDTIVIQFDAQIKDLPAKLTAATKQEQINEIKTEFNAALDKIIADTIEHRKNIRVQEEKDILEQERIANERQRQEQERIEREQRQDEQRRQQAEQEARDHEQRLEVLRQQLQRQEQREQQLKATAARQQQPNGTSAQPNGQNNPAKQVHFADQPLSAGAHYKTTHPTQQKEVKQSEPQQPQPSIVTNAQTNKDNQQAQSNPQQTSAPKEITNADIGRLQKEGAQRRQQQQAIAQQNNSPANTDPNSKQELTLEEQIGQQETERIQREMARANKLVADQKQQIEQEKKTEKRIDETDDLFINTHMPIYERFAEQGLITEQQQIAIQVRLGQIISAINLSRLKNPNITNDTLTAQHERFILVIDTFGKEYRQFLANNAITANEYTRLFSKMLEFATTKTSDELIAQHQLYRKQILERAGNKSKEEKQENPKSN